MEEHPGQLRVLEFYSGVGGMHYALAAAGVSFEVLQALDMNEVANAVYAHNFPTIPVNTTDIGRLSDEWLDKQSADLWTMSPPCQPYTRGGLQKGSQDARSSSLLSLLAMLRKMKHPPRYFLLENVKGFEQSDTFSVLQEVLAERHYSVENFILTPPQFGVPNARVRFYCMARLNAHVPREPHDSIILDTIPVSPSPAKSPSLIHTIADYLEPMLAEGSQEEAQYLVPSSFLKSLARGYRFDIVTAADQDSTCFTKNYAKNFKGSGPLFLPSGSASPSKEEIAAYDVETLQRTWHDDPSKCIFIILDKGLPEENAMNAQSTQKYAMAGDVDLFLSEDAEDDSDEDETSGNQQSDKVKVAEINIMTAEERSRRKGLGKEAMLLMMGYAVTTIGVGKFVAKISEGNAPSIALFTSLGFVEVSRSSMWKEVTMELAIDPERAEVLRKAAAHATTEAYDLC